MLVLFTISAKTLCFILSAQPHELNTIQLAIRRALEEGNSPEELEAMRRSACLTDALESYTVNASGKARRM